MKPQECTVEMEMEGDMDEQVVTAKAGKLLCVDKGEYSDYEVIGFFVVLRDFDPLAELGKFLKKHPKQSANYEFETSMFLASLLRDGLLLEVEFGNLFLGGYGNHEEVRFKPN